MSRNKVYADAEAGVLRLQADGSILLEDLRGYAKSIKRKRSRGGGSALLRLDELKAERLREQVKKLRWEREKDQGKYLLKDAVHNEWAVKLGYLEAVLKNWMRTGAADLVYAVGGDAAKSRGLINLFEARLDDLLDEMGRMEAIEVVVKKLDRPSDACMAANGSSLGRDGSSFDGLG